MLLLLFDTHAGGKQIIPLNPTSVSFLRDFTSTDERGLAKQEMLKESCKEEEDWRNVFLYLGMVAMIFVHS